MQFTLPVLNIKQDQNEVQLPLLVHKSIIDFPHAKYANHTEASTKTKEKNGKRKCRLQNATPHSPLANCHSEPVSKIGNEASSINVIRSKKFSHDMKYGQIIQDILTTNDKSKYSFNPLIPKTKQPPQIEEPLEQLKSRTASYTTIQTPSFMIKFLNNRT